MVKFPRAEFFDILGVLVFSTIALLSGWAITTGKQFPEWGLLFLFSVGLVGIFIDITTVKRAYFRKK